MPLDTIISSTVILGSAPLGLPALNIPMMAAILTVDQGTAWDSIYGATATPLVASVGPSTYVAALKALGVLATEPLHVQMTDLFSQRAPSGTQLAPNEALIGRRATAVAQVETTTVDAFQAGNYTITITHEPGGTVTAFVVPGNTDEPTTAADIRAAIVGIPVTASGAGADVVLTADEAGVPFLVSVTHSATPANISNVNTTPNEGIGEDIGLWRAQNDRWFWFLETTGSSGVITTAANTLEAITPNKIGAFQTLDPLASNGASQLDLASLLGSAGQNLTRSFVVWGPTVNDYIVAASVGKASGALPGASTFEHQSLASVVGSTFTDSDVAALRGKRYTWLELFEATSPPETSTVGGQMLDGTWIDIAWLVQDLINRTQIRVYGALRNNNIPYDGGDVTVESAIRGALNERLDVLVAGTIEVNVPLAAEQSDSDSIARRMAGVTWSAKAKGYVSTVISVGFLAQ